MQQKGFQIEHCRANCPKAARNWNTLHEGLTSNLNELNLRQTLEAKFIPVLHHHLPKISLAGCPNGCSHPNIKDFGISGYVMPHITDLQCSGCDACIHSCLEKAITRESNGIVIDKTLCISCGDCLRVCPTGTLTSGERGWTLRYGGRVGRHPQFAKLAGLVLTDEEVIARISSVLLRYIKEGHSQERLTQFLERYDII